MSEGFGLIPVNKADVVLTPLWAAKAIVQKFSPSGSILDPCCGQGVFLKCMFGADWCEISNGRDFFDWDRPVDWIVSNPPYSIFSDFLRHSMKVARNIVYLIPVNKVFNSYRIMREIYSWGGIPLIYVIGSGADLKFPIGFCSGAVHFQRGYQGNTQVEFYKEIKIKL